MDGGEARAVERKKDVQAVESRSMGSMFPPVLRASVSYLMMYERGILRTWHNVRAVVGPTLRVALEEEDTVVVTVRRGRGKGSEQDKTVVVGDP